MNRDDKKIQTRSRENPGYVFVQNFSPIPGRESSAAKTGVYVCLKCDTFTTTDEKKMKEHMLLRHDPKHVPLYCEIRECKYCAYDEEDWSKHFETHDPNERYWYCPHCATMWEYANHANLCCSKDGLYVQLCKACHGYKTYLGKPCPNCDGTGFAPPGQEWDDSNLRKPRFVRCPGCGGTGKGTLGIFKCGVCNGKQKVINGNFKRSSPIFSLYRHGGMGDQKTLGFIDAAERPAGYTVLKHYRPKF